ncbi:root phototropism protein 3-like [Magnolia sinica]|uniref:root phototropism protein 3-like n=1 Tax=Magnolia sinica TaxID=86752 RepID=UPI00265AC451|nr:root phototropism protein 3-like [Magnolia sinica]
MPVSDPSHNRCVIKPDNVYRSAETLKRSGSRRFVHIDLQSDLTVHIEGTTFHLHTLPMVSRSLYLNRLVFQTSTRADKDLGLNIHIDHLPGGAHTFELVVKFCYGLAVHLTVHNIVSLYCASHFLEMTEEADEGNLISKTEAFLSFVIFSSWWDTIIILKSCEAVVLWANDLQIIKRCCESISWKACIDPQLINSDLDHDNGCDQSHSKMNECWWIEDVSHLTIDHFVKVMCAIKARGMRPELVGQCIMCWATKHFLAIEIKIYGRNNDDDNDHVRLAIEGLIRELPTVEISLNFLLRLLRAGCILNVDRELVIELDKRTAAMLESCNVRDLMVRSLGDEKASSYDVGLVRRVVQAYVDSGPCDQRPREMAIVARIVDRYLTMVGKDDNLSVESFQMVAEVLPENARNCHDSLYMAIDMYLKSHPNLSEDDRKRVCGAMDYHKLSVEARMHALRNERLPLRVTIRYLLFEQVDMARLMLSKGYGYDEFLRPEICEELHLARAEVEKTKVRLSDLKLSHAVLSQGIRLRSNHCWTLGRKNAFKDQKSFLTPD